MNKLLADIELDIKEIRYLMDLLSRQNDPGLQQVVKRRINQIQLCLNQLLAEVESSTTEVAKEEEPVQEELLTTDLPQAEAVETITEYTETITESTETVYIVAESVPVARDVKKCLTLNDRFLYSRELFDGDMSRMDEVLDQVSAMESFPLVVAYLTSILDAGDDNEIFNEFTELIRKCFV